jgi:hypothetical protein
MSLTGMDLAELEALKARLTAEAVDVRSVITRCDAELTAVHWSGPDRDRMVDDWRRRDAPFLRRVAEALEQAAKQLGVYIERHRAAVR